MQAAASRSERSICCSSISTSDALDDLIVVCALPAESGGALCCSLGFCTIALVQRTMIRNASFSLNES